MNWPFFVCALITAISAIVSLGFSVAFVLKEADQARVMALYGCARSLPLAIASAVPLLTGSLAALEAIACVMIVVQACDAAIGVYIKDQMKTFGPAATALANLAALIWLLK
jgi:hypothetical protein